MTSRLAFVSRSCVAAGIVLVGVVADARASDPTKDQCISANEGAQTLRQGGKLQAARARLLICVAKSCPGPVRDDCIERLSDVERSIPTIVFAAKAPDGNDLSAVKVTMDGVLLADRLDGPVLSVDPGEHTFAFAADGYAAVSKKLVIREGVKGRQEVIAFSGAGKSTGSVLAGSTSATEQPGESHGSGQRTLAYVLGGAGLVGVGVGSYFGLKANSTYKDTESHCPTASSCDGIGVAGGQDAHSQATVSTVAFIAGGALLAGGVILFLTAPKDGGVTVQPTAGLTGAGIRMGGAW